VKKGLEINKEKGDPGGWGGGEFLWQQIVGSFSLPFFPFRTSGLSISSSLFFLGRAPDI